MAAAAAPLASVGAAGAENKGRIYFCRINGFFLENPLILHKLGCSGAKTQGDAAIFLKGDISREIVSFKSFSHYPFSHFA